MFDYILSNKDNYGLKNVHITALNIQRLLLQTLNVRIKKGDYVPHFKHNNDAIVTDIKTLLKYLIPFLILDVVLEMKC